MTRTINEITPTINDMTRTINGIAPTIKDMTRTINGIASSVVEMTHLDSFDARGSRFVTSRFHFEAVVDQC